MTSNRSIDGDDTGKAIRKFSTVLEMFTSFHTVICSLTPKRSRGDRGRGRRQYGRSYFWT